MSTVNPQDSLNQLLKEVDLPDRAYELAERRYEDLGAWINRPESSLAPYDAHVFVQGSFAFGTAIRPIVEDEEYDLDFSCKLRNGISRSSHTQSQLKELVGNELAAYRKARGIEKPLVEKNRCWRLGYKDELPFHMDVVPGIRADQARRVELSVRMEQAGIGSSLAQEAARRALWITDLAHPAYERQSTDWPSSNPGGYQLWFVSRMRVQEAKSSVRAQVDPLPVYRSDSTLQESVKLLKRHRDVMFAATSDSKPASIILTTIAGAAYRPGESLVQSVRRILDAFEAVRQSNTDVIPNPVNPLENFADRWTRPDCVKLMLKQNFHAWIRQASRDFFELLDSVSAPRLVELASDSLKVHLSDNTVTRLAGLGAVVASAGSIRTVAAQQNPPRPWCE